VADRSRPRCKEASHGRRDAERAEGGRAHSVFRRARRLATSVEAGEESRGDDQGWQRCVDKPSLTREGEPAYIACAAYSRNADQEGPVNRRVSEQQAEGEAYEQNKDLLAAVSPHRPAYQRTLEGLVQARGQNGGASNCLSQGCHDGRCAVVGARADHDDRTL